jgi:hypothetical protein
MYLLKISQKDVESLRTLSFRTFFICMSTDVFPSGRFVPPDVWSSGRFVPPGILSFQTFRPAGRFVPRMLCLQLLCSRTFCLWMFCPSARYVSGSFVWAPLEKLGLEVNLQALLLLLVTKNMACYVTE